MYYNLSKYSLLLGSVWLEVSMSQGGAGRLYELVHAQSLRHVWLLSEPLTVACQTAVSLWFPRQAYWIELPFPPSRDLPNPGIKPSLIVAGGFGSPVLPNVLQKFHTPIKVYTCYLLTNHIWFLSALVKTVERGSVKEVETGL